MWRLFSDPTTALDELAAEYGRTFQLSFGVTRVIVVGEGELVGLLLGDDVECYRWGLALQSIKVVTGRTGMLVSDGEARVCRVFG